MNCREQIWLASGKLTMYNVFFGLFQVLYAYVLYQRHCNILTHLENPHKVQ